MKKKLSIILFLILFLPFSLNRIIANSELILGGDSIGVEGQYNGVYVSGTYQFRINETIIKPEQNIRTHDLIIQIDKQPIYDLTSFKNAVSNYQEVRNEIPITILREQNKLETTLISTNTNEGVIYGLYLKEKVLGI
ncbi:MAG: hypothetical protein EOM11_06755 [Erysipelotrichia bacterium]|nr:hypothetical protein [Erysipelotrichia bacterium]